MKAALQEKEHSGLTASEGIFDLQKVLMLLPDKFHHTLEVMHHFLPGIYVRTVLMKAGDIVVGKMHKQAHIAIISAGQARVVGNEHGLKSFTAPCIFMSEARAKRALFIEEDCVWTTIHPNPSNTQDLVQLEQELIISEDI